MLNRSECCLEASPDLIEGRIPRANVSHSKGHLQTITIIVEQRSRISPDPVRLGQHLPRQVHGMRLAVPDLLQGSFTTLAERRLINATPTRPFLSLVEVDIADCLSRLYTMVRLVNGGSGGRHALGLVSLIAGLQGPDLFSEPLANSTSKERLSLIFRREIAIYRTMEKTLLSRSLPCRQAAHC
jgi:hypothetical protein